MFAERHSKDTAPFLWCGLFYFYFILFFNLNNYHLDHLSYVVTNVKRINLPSVIIFLFPQQYI